MIFEVKGKDGIKFEFKVDNIFNISNEFDQLATQNNLSEEDAINTKILILSFLNSQKEEPSSYEDLYIQKELEKVTLIHAL